MQMILDKNLFVIMIDANKKEYRYHDILREYLLHLLEQDQEEKKRKDCTGRRQKSAFDSWIMMKVCGYSSLLKTMKN